MKEFRDHICCETCASVMITYQQEGLRFHFCVSLSPVKLNIFFIEFNVKFISEFQQVWYDLHGAITAWLAAFSCLILATPCS